MSPERTHQQISDLIDRLIESGLSVKQFHPSVRKAPDGITLIGRKQSTGIALRDIPYEEVYKELDSTEAYDAKLVDGGLLLLQYKFSAEEGLIQHRLAYFPSPQLPTVDDAPELYEQDELYADVVARNIVRFPIRFDYAPKQAINLDHPASHLTLGQYENCRIPVTGPMSPNAFGVFIIRNFYWRAYSKNKNVFNKKPPQNNKTYRITDDERRLIHVFNGR
jgi:hypothetical protein